MKEKNKESIRSALFEAIFVVLAVVLALLFGTPEGSRTMNRIWILIVMGGLGGGFATASVGLLQVVVGPKLRLFFLKKRGTALVVACGFALFLLGIFAAAWIFG